MSTSLRVFIGRSMALGLRSWRRWDAESRRLRRLLSMALVELQGCGMRRAWRSWRSALPGKVAMLGGQLDPSLVRALRTWAAYAAVAGERRRLLRLGAGGLARRCERRAPPTPPPSRQQVLGVGL